MKVNFFSVALLAALALFETSQAVPLHITSNADAGPEASLATLGTSGNQMESALSSLMADTNNLTKALMDKMTKDISKPDDKGCTLQDRLDNGFTLSLDNFEVGGLVPDCKPAPPEQPKCNAGCPATVTISKVDPCEEKCPAAAPKTATLNVKTSPATATPKMAPTPAEKTADKADAIKKLEAAKPKQ